MSEDQGNASLAQKRVLYESPGLESVRVRSAIYRESGLAPLTLDVYRPIVPEEDRLAAVVLVAGYPDAGYERILGCKFKDTGAATSWARLIAASGLVAITYTNEEPIRDARALLAFVRGHADSLSVDASRLGLLATSGNVPLALALAWESAPGAIACAALYYGFMPDDSGSALVTEAASKWRFANPFAGASFEGKRLDVPLFIARGGRDEMPHLNASIDGFVTAALAQNLPLTVVNHPEGPHAFDLFHDSELTRTVIRQSLTFLTIHLT